MALPRIQNPFGGTVIPAQDEQRYEDLFFTSLTLDVDRPDPFLRLGYKQYNYDTKEFNPSGARQDLSITDFWTWVGTPRANAEAPTLREQWIGLGLMLGQLEMTLKATVAQLKPLQDRWALECVSKQGWEMSLAGAQNDLANAQDRLNALPEDADAETRALIQSQIDNAQMLIQSSQASVDAITATAAATETEIAPLQATISAVKTQLGIQ